MKQTYCFFSTFAHRVLTVASARAKLLTAIALCLFSVGNAWADYTLEFQSTETTNDGSQLLNNKDDIFSTGLEYVESVKDITRVYKGKSGYGVKLGSGKGTGALTINLSTVGSVNVTGIVINAAQYGSDRGNLKVTLNGSTTQTKTLTKDLTGHEVSFSGKLTSIKVESTLNRIYIKSITVVTGPTTYTITNFLTNVTADADNPEKFTGTEDYVTLYYTAKQGYTLPSTISVLTSGGKQLSVDYEYSWWIDKNGKGNLQLYPTNIKNRTGLGDIVITIKANAVEDPCQGITLDAPTVTVSDLNPTGFTLSWSAVAGAEGYNVYLFKGTNPTQEVVESITATTYTFTNLTPNETYEWEVEAAKETCYKTTGRKSVTTPKRSYTVTWMLDGAAYTAGNPTTKVFEGEGITALPTPPADDALGECANKFMGWSTTNLGSEEGKTAPANLFKTVAEAPTITDNTTFYAVYATASTTSGGNTMTWKKITTANELTTGEIYAIITTEEEFYIASDVASSSNPSAQKVTKDGDAIAILDAMKWKVSKDGSGFVFESFSQSGVYLWGSSTNDGIRINTSSGKKNATKVWCPEQDDSYGVVLYNNAEQSNRYLEVYNSTDWRNYTSKTTGKIGVLYVYSSSTPTTYTNYVTACKEEVCNLSVPLKPLSNNITSSGATLTWNAVTGATGYVVTLTTGGVSKEIPTTDNQCELTELQPATDYTWTVKATKGTCESVPCSTKEFTTLVPCTPLAMPTNVKVEWIEGDQYQLSWDKVTNATSYKITGQFYTASIKQNYTIRELSDLTRGREYSGTIIAMNPGDYRYCDSNPADYSFVYKPYRVTFNAGSGTCPVASSEETTIEELPEAQNNCEGWEFVGWSTIPCSETTTLPALVTAPYTPTSDHTLYAVYAKTEEGVQSDDFNSVDVDNGDLVSGEEYVLTAYNSVNEYALSCNETDISGNYETKQISSVVIDEDNDGVYDYEQLTTTDTDIIWSLIGDGTNGYYFKHVATGKCLINDAGNLLLSDTGEPIRFLISHPNTTSYRVKVQLKDESKYLSGYEKDDKYGILFNIYTRSTLDLYLYKRTSATIYTYSSNPSCKECVDAGAAFEQTLIKKKDIGISFVNPVTYATPNPSPAFYSSSDPSVATVDNTGKVTTVGMGSTIITLAQARYVTDSEQDVCAVEISYQLEVGVEMEIVEWETDGVILHIEKDDKANPQVVISGEHEYGNTGGNKAEDLFFSKYFEAAGTTKLLAVYNGTDHKISLSDIVVWHRESQKFSLAELGNKEKGFIYPNEEIIFFNKGEYSSCAETMEGYDRWFNVEAAALNFGGTGTLTLCRGETIIDMIGAYQDGKPKDGPQKPDWGDKPGFTCSNGVNYVTKESGYGLSTNRCLLIRNNTVVSGKNAVVKNSNGEFVTLCEEWSGLQIKKVDDAMTATCEGFKNVGIFDYSTYYKTLVTIDDTKTLDDYKHNEAENTYRIPIDGGVAQYSCLAMQFQLVDNNKKVLISKTVKVPILVTSEQATTDAIFSNIIADDYAASKERCKDCDVVVLGNATLTKVEAGTANDVNQVRSLKVYPGGKLVLPATSNDYTLNNIALRRKDDKVAKAELSGTPALSAPLPYSLDLYVSAENWHFFTLPYACNIADVTFANGSAAIYGRDWFLMYYDGAQRAATQDGGCWKSVDAGKTPVLEPGVGYIVGIAGYEKQTVRQELRFPMAAHDESGAKSVPVKAYGAGQDISPEHKGWNLVGNPYMNDYQKDNLNSFHGLTLGKLEWIGKNPVTYELSGNVPYLAKPIQNGWVGYEQVLVSETDLLPFTCYFVQVGNDGDTDGQDFAVLFDADRKVKSNIVRRAPAEYDAETDPVLVEVVLENAAGETDKTALVIGDNYTERYEIGADFVKMFGDAYRSYSLPVVYTVATDGKRAFNALPENAASQFVPLGMYAAQTGNYTFSLNQGYDLSRVAEVWLYDAESGTHTNLMQRDYTFTTVPTESSNRFSLSVRLLPKVVTSTEQLPAGVTLTSFDRTLHVGNLPQGAHLWVYDTTGKLLYSETAHNVQHVYPVTQAGVYYVRVESNLGNVTLRTIVK